MYLYNRTGEITIGKPGERGVVITGLNFSFDFKKTITSEMNPGTLMIYNLSQSTSQAIHELETVCIVKVGYSEAEGPVELFRGYVSKVSGSRNGPDYITNLELRDGYQELKSSKFAKSYSKNTSLDVVVGDIVKSLGLPKGFEERLVNIARTKLKRGMSFNGLSKDALTDISAVAGIEWSVQSGKLKLLEKGKSDGTQSVYLSKNTGLIRSPERTSDITVGKDAAGKDKKQVGWKIESLLMPRIEPGNLIRVYSNRIQGDFKVITVQHTGELLGSDITTVLEVVEI